MTVTIEPLAIGSLTGPWLYILVRRVGTHLDIEQMPDEIVSDRDAEAYAAKRWGVPLADVLWKPVQVVELEGQ